MQKIIKLNLEDLKEIVSEKFGCKPNEIKVDVYKSSGSDGMYYQSDSVFFTFEVKE